MYNLKHDTVITIKKGRKKIADQHIFTDEFGRSVVFTNTYCTPIHHTLLCKGHTGLTFSELKFQWRQSSFYVKWPTCDLMINIGISLGVICANSWKGWHVITQPELTARICVKQYNSMKSKELPYVVGWHKKDSHEDKKSQDAAVWRSVKGYSVPNILHSNQPLITNFSSNMLEEKKTL
jgi:hypothetical protein